jgi:predicted RNase H-like nuclease (RuvC/YqgF family)
MESTDATLVLASRTGNPQMLQSNRLHVRILVGGNELELTNERTDDKAESVNIQELISAFTGVLKETINTDLIKSRLDVENVKESDNGTEHQEVKTEIMRLKQLLQKFEGEIKHLRQLVQESKKENEELKIRFRSATHMKAAEVAQRYSRVSAVQSATNGRGFESITDSEEPYTPEQRPTEFAMNPQVKEIDFLSLDDILGNDDAVEIISKETTRDAAEEDDNTAMENSGSGSGTVGICPH